MDALRRLPPIVWGLLVPALIIGAVQLRRPDGRRVHVVGAGYIAGLTEGDESSDAFFYDTDTSPHEPIEQTVTRTRALLSHWPRVVVVGFDVAAMAEGDVSAARLKIRALAKKLEDTQVVPVLLPPRAAPGDSPAAHALADELVPWFDVTLCQTGKLRRCAKLDPGATPPADWKTTLEHTVAEAVRFQSTLPSAQIGH